MLNAGGVLIVTTASPARAPHSAIDGGALRPGEHYAGVSEDDLMRWARESGFLAVGQTEANVAAADVYGVFVRAR